MALFKPYKITSDKLEDLAIKEGQLIVTTDTKKLYVDVSATERIEVTADAEVDLSNYVTTSILTSTIGEEASARQKQDQLLEQAIDDKVGADDIIAGSNIQVNHDDISGHITISATDTNTNTTYTLSKSGSTITLSGSDGSSTSVTDANTTYSLGSFGVTASAAELNKLDGVTATATELNYVDGVTSNIQTQLNGKAATNHTHNATSDITSGTLPIVRGGTNASTAKAAQYNLLNDMGNDTTTTNPVDSHEWISRYSTPSTTNGVLVRRPLSHLWNYVYSKIKAIVIPADIAAANATHTHGADDVTGLTASRALISNANGHPAVSDVTSTELNMLDGVTSNVQTQLNGKAATSHTHSYLPLSGGTLTGTLNSRAIAPTATNTYSLGTSSLKYKAVYATTFYGSLSGNASSATKLGSSTVGSSVKPIYLNEGAATASSSTVGSATRPVYLNNGAITQGTYILGAACAKGVDTSISTGSTSTNLPTSKAVAALVASSGGGQEIAIQSTEPTDSNIKLWIKI